MSDALHVLPPFILAAVLIASGVAKLRHPDDLDGWRELGVPAALRRTWLLKLHPWGEIALAVALLVFGGVLGLLAALAAVALMVVYLVLVWRVLRQPEDASCACFGEQKPVTTGTVVRNAWLTLIAVVAASVIWALPLLGGAIAAAGPVWGWVFGAAVAAATAVLIVRGEQPTAGSEITVEPSLKVPVTAAVPRSSAVDRAAHEEAPAQDSAPDQVTQEFRLDLAGTEEETGISSQYMVDLIADMEARAAFSDLFSDAAPAPAAAEPADPDDYVRTRTPAVPVALGDGTPVNLRALSMMRPLLLLAVSDTCGSCAPVIEAADAWRARLPEVGLHLLLTSEPGASRLTSAQEPLTLHDPHGYVRGSIADWQTPSAVLLGGDGLLAGGPVTGFAEISAFIDDIEASLADVRGPFDN